jgi:hypothetical protein
MKKQVKGFGQFVNEAGYSESDSMSGIIELGVFRPEAMLVTLLNAGDDMSIPYPTEDAEMWESGDWHNYVCEMVMQDDIQYRINAIWFPEDSVIIKC